MKNLRNAQDLNEICEELLPGHLGIEMLNIGDKNVTAQMAVQKHHMAPNGYLHAASIIALADTSCGNGTMANLPEGASGFTTIELKSNHLGTVKQGIVNCTAKAIHTGRTTQVWDAEVFCGESGKMLAQFRCTQMILYK